MLHVFGRAALERARVFHFPERNWAVRYEIYADEAWTHGGAPPNRYFCFYGGIFGLSSDLDRLDGELRKILRAHNARGEVKWSNLTTKTERLFRELVECLGRYIESGAVRYRQMFCDRSCVRESVPGEAEVSELDVQFKLFYQFLKHAFGFKHLPATSVDQKHEILIRLDTHSSQRHKDELIRFTENLPIVLGRSDVEVRVTFVNSANVPRIQICDVLMGAAGSYGNKMQLRRAPGQRGMSEKQNLRYEFAKFIYNKIRQISCSERGTMAFNWFESTGKDGDWTNIFHHKIRIWKFLPRRYRTDRGWQNARLDRRGMFIASDLSPQVLSASGDFSY